MPNVRNTQTARASQRQRNLGEDVQNDTQPDAVEELPALSEPDEAEFAFGT